MECALFAGMTDSERADILRCLSARRVEMARGQTLFFEGDAAGEIGVVAAGAVQVRTSDCFGNQSILAHLQAGELFGEAFACSGMGRYPVEVVCQQPGEVLLLNYRRVLSTCPRTCAHHARLIENMIAVLAGKNLRLMEKTRVLSRRSTREKLLTYLSIASREAGSSSFRLPFSRQEMADYLCVERSAMTVELMRLKREGLLGVDGRRVTLHSAARDMR